MKRNVLMDGNGSDTVMIEGLGVYVPVSQVRSMQAELERLRTANLDSVAVCEQALQAKTAVEQERDQLKDEVPPNECGSNRYGLDCSYFRGVINRELNRPLVDFKPDELARVLMRMAVTADAAVLSEPEFLRRVDLAQHDAEVIERALDHLERRATEEGYFTIDPIWLKEYADQLRQQAKEAQS
ncbi:hypothetical protein [Marinobacterium sp. BA1]|uniref:hypothetical protein n=1 Tax=Marinobacterium sp. BA1 TaxID=3138931 RepID=UPI0032E76D96